MPSPVGHALGGLIAVFVVNALAWRPGLTLPLLAAAAAISVAPDLDLLVGSHRTYSHSVGGIAIVFVMSWLLLRTRVSRLAATAASDCRIRIAHRARLDEQRHVATFGIDGAVALHNEEL